MLTLSKPTRHAVNRFLQACENRRFTYDQIGATLQNRMPSGFSYDSCQIRLGKGRSTFRKAIGAFQEWKMFPHAMTKVLTPTASIDVGQSVAIQFRAFLFWSVCPCRIVYVINEQCESASRHRYGFAYGTLPGHVEQGEERFLLEWNRETDEVWYSIIAFSTPRHFLAKLAYPYARYQQWKFRKLSCESMSAAVATSV